MQIPESINAYIMRSRCFKELGNLESAIKDLEYGLSLSTKKDDKDFLNMEIKRLEKNSQR